MSASTDEIWITSVLGKNLSSSEKKINTNTTFVLLLVVVIVIYAIVAQRRRKNKRFNELIRKIPDLVGPKLPILGHAHHLLNLKTLASELSKIGVDVPRVMWFGPMPFVLITQPEDLEILFNNTNAIHKHYLYKIGLPYIGEGLITAPAHKWRQNKKMIMPAFNQAMLNSFVEIFYKKALVMNEILAEKNGKTIDILEIISKCIVDSVCQTIMGIPFDGQRNENNFANAVCRRVYLCGERVYNIFLHPHITYMMTSAYWELIKIGKMTTDFTMKVITQKREELKLNSEEFTGDKKKTFLQILLEASHGDKKFSDNELVDEVNTFFAAGIDTSSNAIAFALISLALCPEIEEKVYKEIIEVIGHEKAVEHSDLPKLEYLGRVLKETLRIFPTIPMIGRTIRDAEIKLDSCILPKGCSIVYPIFAINRAPELFKDPLKFDPDRFLPEEIAKRPSLSYIPFGAGPRKCIGYQYAALTLKSIVATLVRKFRFETDFKTFEEVDLEARTVLTSSKGYPIRAIARA